MKSKNLHVGAGAWWPATVIAVLIFAASSLPGRALPPPTIPHLDKAEHALAYALLGAACARGLTLMSPAATLARSPLVTVLAAAGMAAAYGASDELHQAFVPGRTPDLSDLLADAMGALVGASGWSLRRNRKRRLPAERRS